MTRYQRQVAEYFRQNTPEQAAVAFALRVWGEAAHVATLRKFGALTPENAGEAMEYQAAIQRQYLQDVGLGGN